MLQSFLQKTRDIGLDILFPPLCLNCERYLERPTAGATETYNNSICDNCYNSIKLNSTLFCGVCRARLPENKKICHSGATYLLGAASNYDDPVLQNLIHYFKYKSFKNLAPLLGGLMIKYFGNLGLEIGDFTVVPIPLHPRRERTRGFNQSQILGEILTNHYDLPIENYLKRIKNNKPQVALRDNKEREKNITGCFDAVNPQKIKGKNIILVDDVSTSGATLTEAARVLKETGARKIIGLVLAKT